MQRAGGPILIIVVALVGGGFALASSLAGRNSSGHAVTPLPTSLGAPSAPYFVKTPAAVTTSTRARFAYADSQSGVNFSCSLDAAADHGCGRSSKVNNLSPGAHRFCVKAANRYGSSNMTCYSWTVSTVGLPFSISGDPAGLLSPGGASVPVDLVFTNPNSSPITIGSVSISVSGATPSGCAAWVVASQQLLAAPTVAAGATSSLQQLGVPANEWPQLEMTDSGGNQDGCEGATISLSYSGSATG